MQDSYGAMGGNLSIELKAMLQEHGKGADCRVLSRVYGLGGRDVRVEDMEGIFETLKQIDKDGNAGETYRYLGVRE